MSPRNTTRQRMLTSAVELLMQRGAAGVTIDAILAHSQAPRGSVYHHFPNGRSQIMAEALDLAGDRIVQIINESVSDGPKASLRQVSDFWTGILEHSDFAAGCPVVAVVVGSADDDRALMPQVAAIFAHWRTAIADSLVAEGVDRARADALAAMSIAAVEGAVVMCRVERTTEPLRAIVTELELMLDTVLV